MLKYGAICPSTLGASVSLVGRQGKFKAFLAGRIAHGDADHSATEAGKFKVEGVRNLIFRYGKMGEVSGLAFQGMGTDDQLSSVELQRI
jgi:hypothetical protein